MKWKNFKTMGKYYKPVRAVKEQGKAKVICNCKWRCSISFLKSNASCSCDWFSIEQEGGNCLLAFKWKCFLFRNFGSLHTVRFFERLIQLPLNLDEAYFGRNIHLPIKIYPSKDPNYLSLNLGSWFACIPESITSMKT